MIFATVGGQVPFDRLIHSLDEWARARQRDDVFAQIGRKAIPPRHIRFVEFLDPDEFRSRVETADAIVAHAGMGSIITALEFGRPILVMPRRSFLKETRTDHQVDTARRLQEQGFVEVASDEKELWIRLDELDAAVPRKRIGDAASPELIRVLRDFIGEA